MQPSGPAASRSAEVNHAAFRELGAHKGDLNFIFPCCRIARAASFFLKGKDIARTKSRFSFFLGGWGEEEGESPSDKR